MVGIKRVIKVGEEIWKTILRDFLGETLASRRLEGIFFYFPDVYVLGCCNSVFPLLVCAAVILVVETLANPFFFSDI